MNIGNECVRKRMGWTKLAQDNSIMVGIYQHCDIILGSTQTGNLLTSYGDILFT